MGAVSTYPLDTADATDFLLGTDSTGTVKRFAMSGVKPTRTIYKLTLAHSNATVTPTTIASTIADVDWIHTLVAGKTYRFNIYGQYQTIGLGTGARLNLLGAGGLAGLVAGGMWGAIAQGTNATSLDAGLYSFANGAGSFLLTTSVSPINAPHMMGSDFIFECSTGGTLALQFASEVAASAAQMNAGSFMLVEELN